MLLFRFLDRLCTHIIAFEDKQVVFVEGTYTDYEADRRKRLGDLPKDKFRKLYVL